MLNLKEKVEKHDPMQSEHLKKRIMSQGIAWNYSHIFVEARTILLPLYWLTGRWIGEWRKANNEVGFTELASIISLEGAFEV